MMARNGSDKGCCYELMLLQPTTYLNSFAIPAMDSSHCCFYIIDNAGTDLIIGAGKGMDQDEALLRPGN